MLNGSRRSQMHPAEDSASYLQFLRGYLILKVNAHWISERQKKLTKILQITTTMHSTLQPFSPLSLLLYPPCMPYTTSFGSICPRYLAVVEPLAHSMHWSCCISFQPSLLHSLSPWWTLVESGQHLACFTTCLKLHFYRTLCFVKSHCCKWCIWACERNLKLIRISHT